MARVSIGVPVYNGDKYLGLTLNSLLAQRFGDFEIVISDNASTDCTAEICRAYQSKDKRIRYFRSETNFGAAWNHNRVFELSSAPLFKWCSHDDLHEPSFLERCVAVLDSDSSVVLSHTYVKMIDETGEPLRYDHERDCFIHRSSRQVRPPDRNHLAEAAEPERRFKDILSHMWWGDATFGVMRRDQLLKTSGLGSYWGADKVLMAELSVQGRFHQVGEALFARRIHEECSLHKNADELAEHIGSSCFGGIYRLSMLQAYVKLVMTAEVSLRQRTHCLASVARLTLRSGPWQELLAQLASIAPHHSLRQCLSRK